MQGGSESGVLTASVSDSLADVGGTTMDAKMVGEDVEDAAVDMIIDTNDDATGEEDEVGANELTDSVIMYSSSSSSSNRQSSDEYVSSLAASHSTPLSTAASTSSLTDTNVGVAQVEVDGLGVKGYLSMRDEGVTYHRMKRYYCRCVGVNFFRFSSRESASVLINAVFGAEIQKVEQWDGKGLWHTYKNSFKLYFTNGVVFNADADSEEDRKKWIEHIQTALDGDAAALATWTVHAETTSSMLLSPGGLSFAEKKTSAPKFKNLVACCHPKCTVRFDGAASKRQHHCRNCGGTVCSDHSSRFATLRHFQMNHAVRLCMGCHRVQRLALSLAMLVQRVSTAQVKRVQKPPLSQADAEEIEALEMLFAEPGFGISDVIQVLHLHRHGCDEAYAHVVNKLLELATTNLPDFEFFLPQLFHLWLTVDWSRNNIKAALLFRVISFASQLHIRLATSIYWLTRAAIDDSCGWGFGQSELFVPDYLFRKLSMCKLMMSNLELQISRGNWTFQPDRDIPAPELQGTMIQCLFDRIFVLLYGKTKGYKSPLGAICDAISLCCIPSEFLPASDLLFQPGAGTEDEVDGDVRRIFDTQMQFIEDLCAMTERLRHNPPDQRKAALKLELEKINLPEYAFCPLGSCEDPLLRFVTIARDEGTVFTTRARAPTLIFFEVEMLAGLAENSSWLQRARSLTTSSVGHAESRLSHSIGSQDSRESLNGASDNADGSKNAIEMATKSDIGQALSLNTLSEETEANAMDDKDHAPIGGADLSTTTMANGKAVDDDSDTDSDESRDRVPSNPPLVRNKKKSRRRRSGSLVNTAPKSLESIINACSSTITSHRKRAASEGGDVDENSQALENEKPVRNEVEKFTQDQMISMAQTLERSMYAKSPTRQGVFTGKEAVDWMTQNEIVSDKNHALWLGGELVSCGAIEASSSSTHAPRTFSPCDDVSYRLRSDSTTIPKLNGRGNILHAGDKSSGSSPISSFDGPRPSQLRMSSRSANGSSRIINSQEKKPFDVVSLASAVDETFPGLASPRSTVTQHFPSTDQDRMTVIGEERRSMVSTVHFNSAFEKFQPEAALSAIESVERAMLEHVLSRHDLDNVEQLRDDLRLLKDQMETLCEYVADKRKRRHIAVESAFGESFEEKKERLRIASQYFKLSQSNNWDCVAFIVKSNDDLRQEVLCMQLIRQLQDIFQSADLPLRLLPYGIIATSASTGMIEYIKNATSLDGLKKTNGYTTLANHFLKTYGDPEANPYKTAMTNFVRSMAAYSLACYFLQIKDRHNGNIMIDSEGHVVHIDFGFILGIAPGGRFSLETAPFKLTAEMVDAMGGTQSEYFKAYVIFLIQGFLALQQHADTVLMMIAIMAQESSCPCFLSQNPRDILSATKRLFRLEMNQSEVIKYVLSLVRRSHNSYRTRQYDVFQRMTNGILP